VDCASGVGVGVIDQGVSRLRAGHGHLYRGNSLLLLSLLNIQMDPSFRLFSDLLAAVSPPPEKMLFSSSEEKHQELN
jgi:hypothetical protein